MAIHAIHISIHALLAESDVIGDVMGKALAEISIHALLAESDPGIFMAFCVDYLFLSTLSLRRATMVTKEYSPCDNISIHALLAESDLPLRDLKYKPDHFYPRSPCGERQCVKMDSYLESIISIHALLAESDSMLISWCCGCFVFLSTLSLRRATPG